mgnify:CR=1 FL=1
MKFASLCSNRDRSDKGKYLGQPIDQQGSGRNLSGISSILIQLKEDTTQYL